MRNLVLIIVALFTGACATTSSLSLPPECEQREMAPTDTRTYRVALRAGDVLDVAMEQQGIDLVVELRDQNARPILSIDSPNGAQGPEKLMWVANAPAVVQLTIRPFDKRVSPGRYQLCAATRVATQVDRQIADEIALLAEAWDLRGIGLRYEPGAAAYYIRARDAAERGLGIRERRAGRDDVSVAAFLDILGYIEDELGDYRKGTDYFQRALALRRAAGQSGRDVLRTESDLAYLYLGHGDAARAVEQFRSVIAADPNRTGTKQGLATALVDLGRLDEAEALTREQLQADAARLGPGNEALTFSFARLGKIALARGDRAAAKEHFNQALAVARRSMDRATALTGLAQIALEEGDAKTACARAVEARSLRAAAFGLEHPSQVLSMTIQAEALAQLADRDAARDLIAAARRLAARFYLPTHPWVKKLERTTF